MTGEPVFNMNLTTSTGETALLRSDKEGWSILEALIIGIGVLVIYLAFLFVLERNVVFLTTQLELTQYQKSAISQLLSLVFTIAIVMTPLAVVRKQNFIEMGRTVPWNLGKWKFISALVSGIFLAISFNLAVTFIYGTAGTFREGRIPLTLSLYIGSAVFLQPVVEEVYFRGILFAALSRRFSAQSSITAVTILFIILHPGHRLDVLPIAIALGIMRLATNSVSSCFVLHASYNFFLALYQIITS